MNNEERKNRIQDYLDFVFEQIKHGFDTESLGPKIFPDILLMSEIGIKTQADKEIWEKIGYTLCYEIKTEVEVLKKYNKDISSLVGFGYQCFAVDRYCGVTGRLKSFSKHLKELFLKELISAVRKHKYEIFRTKTKDYDCISGVAGALNLVLSINDVDEKLCREAIENAAQYLVELTHTHNYDENLVYNFSILNTDEPILKDGKVSFERKINFGMSHGMMGPLAALSKTYSQGYRTIGIEEAIDTLYGLYEKYCVIKDGIAYWPGQLSYEEFVSGHVKDDSLHYASSWCYGNTGVLCGIIKVCENMGWDDRKCEYEELLFSAMNKSMDEFYLVSPGLCHGFSSVLAGRLALFNTKYWNMLDDKIDENIEQIIFLSHRNTKEAKAHPELIETEEGRLEGYIGEYSLLNGVVGIAAVFAELAYEIDGYRKILMI